MPDRREEIIGTYQTVIPESDVECISKEDAKDAMDEYMKECCLEFIQWMLDKGVFATCVVDGEASLYYRGEYITKEQLFENFL